MTDRSEANIELLNCPQDPMCAQACDDVDPISQFPIPAEHVIRLRINGALRCYDIEGLYEALTHRNMDPVSRGQFSAPQLARITAAYRALPGNAEAEELHFAQDNVMTAEEKWNAMGIEEGDPSDDDPSDDDPDGYLDPNYTLEALEADIQFSPGSFFHVDTLTVSGVFDRMLRRRLNTVIERARVNTLRLNIQDWPSPEVFRVFRREEFTCQSFSVYIRSVRTPLAERQRTLLSLLNNLPRGRLRSLSIALTERTPWTREFTTAFLRPEEGSWFSIPRLRLGGLIMSPDVRRHWIQECEELREAQRVERERWRDIDDEFE